LPQNFCVLVFFVQLVAGRMNPELFFKLGVGFSAATLSTAATYVLVPDKDM